MYKRQVCLVICEPYKDLHGDTVDETELEKAYMVAHGRAVPLYKGHNMDDRTSVGSVAYAPMTADIQKALGLTGDNSGLIGYAHITDADVKKAIANGETPDMSIEALAVDTKDG